MLLKDILVAFDGTPQKIFLNLSKRCNTTAATKVFGMKYLQILKAWSNFLLLTLLFSSTSDS